MRDQSACGLFVTAALLHLTACGALTATTASTEAKTALQCPTLDWPYALPHRYGNVGPSHEVYRGCGKYVVLRCAHSTVQDSCQTVEVLDARTAEAAEPLSFQPASRR